MHTASESGRLLHGQDHGNQRNASQYARKMAGRSLPRHERGIELPFWERSIHWSDNAHRSKTSSVELRRVQVTFGVGQPRFRKSCAVDQI